MAHEDSRDVKIFMALKKKITTFHGILMTWESKLPFISLAFSWCWKGTCIPSLHCSWPTQSSKPFVYRRFRASGMQGNAYHVYPMKFPWILNKLKLNLLDLSDLIYLFLLSCTHDIILAIIPHYIPSSNLLDSPNQTRGCHLCFGIPIPIYSDSLLRTYIFHGMLHLFYLIQVIDYKVSSNCLHQCFRIFFLHTIDTLCNCLRPREPIILLFGQKVHYFNLLITTSEGDNGSNTKTVVVSLLLPSDPHLACKRALNRRHPEATILRTYIV